MQQNTQEMKSTWQGISLKYIRVYNYKSETCTKNVKINFEF
jgi:hypothetical protein